MTAAASPATAPFRPTRAALHRTAGLLALLLTVPALAQTRPATTAATTVPATEPYRPTLLAHGSADRYWIAHVETYQDAGKARLRTIVRGQELPAGDWQDLGIVYAHAVALAESQGQLALLLEDGSWRRRAPSGLATGPAIPGTGSVVAFASSSRDLYAIRGIEGGLEGATTATRPVDPAPRPAATTQAAPATRTAGPSIGTRPSVSAANPTTSPRPATRPTRPVLLQFQRGEWTPVADLPPGIGTGPVALAVVADKPVLAVAVDGVVRTHVWADNRWQDFGQIRPPQRPGGFGLLVSGGTLPALWTIDPDGAMSLFLKREGEDWKRAEPFALPPNLPENAQRTLASAGQDFRLVVLKDGQIWERRYDTAGAPRSELAQLPAPQGNRQDALFWAIRGFVIIGMVIVMLLTFYHRRPVPEDTRDER